MAISSLLTTVTSAIESISISGVTVRDYDGVVVNWVSTPNVLYPNPDNFLTNFSLEYKSFTHGASAQVDFSYTLNYTFLGTQVGNIGNFPTAYKDLVDKVVLIINAIVTNHSAASGDASIELGAVAFSALNDPAGNQYHGANIAINVTEMQNT